MTTKTLRPDHRLSHCVKSILVIDEPQDAGALTIPFYADGYPGIMYQQSQSAMFINSTDRISAQLFLYGQTVKPVNFITCGRYRMIVFFLHPQLIKPLFGINANELTDTCLDLDLLIPNAGGSFADRLLNTVEVTEQITTLSNLLVKLLSTRALRTDPSIDGIVTRILATGGQAPIKELRAQSCLSERTLERRFEQAVGITPKLFSRIIQFQASFGRVHSGNYSLLSDIAFEQGYADQSHFIRSFREFTGFAPLDLYEQQYIF